VYSSVSFASSVVIFFLSSVLRWALRILLYRFGILGMNPCLRRYFLGITTIDTTKGKLGQYFGILKLAGAPFSLRKGGGALAPFCTLLAVADG
jgi:hypothetical protein